MVTGFLGSGKTTLLKNLLNQHATNYKIGIIQNEFAPAGIDGVELAQSGHPFQLLEIHNGSVFCVCLLGEFMQSLSRFIDDKQPDLVILESSGLSDPIAIAQLLEAPPLKKKLFLSHIWCVIDSFNFQCTAAAQLQVIRQIRIADTLIMNKTDLCETGMETMKASLLEWNPFARIVSASFCNIPFELFSQFQMQPVAITRQGQNQEFESCGRPDNINSVVLKSGRKITPENFRIFIGDAIIHTYRAKGYICLNNGKTLAVQSVFGHLTTAEITGYHNLTEMIFIGPDVNASDLNRKFKILSA
jgi:G3E family GTPase